MKTKVGIIGAGPAGLMLSHLLHLTGIPSIIIESQSREYCEARVRAGLLEQWAADMLIETGAGARMQRECMTHSGIHISFGGALHDIDFLQLVGKQVTIYGQQEIVKDLIAQQLANGTPILFEASNVRLEGINGSHPAIHFTQDGQEQTIECDFIGGCDGFHGICRPTIPANVLTTYEREYPFGWLGILAQARPVADKLIYCSHPNGFALFSMRAPTLVRYYLQCTPNEDLNAWSDQRIWDELETRLGGTRPLERGPLIEKVVAPMRSFVVEPMQYGRLFLAGDSAHIVPSTGAKGMNLAFADARVLSQALSAFYRNGTTNLLEGYSRTCLDRVWKAQRFSWWMTRLFHSLPRETPFDSSCRLAELEHLVQSEAAAKSLAENYAGLSIDIKI
ncbi:MAG: 4-hydroxybenzoate 3-monooxygenase [Verrucomicrobia bacterium]|nr:4-hydroxybenzoate 3-monooxygenase [Verrucomicrobiota bacterium]